MDDETPEFNSYCENHFLKKAILGTLQADSQSMGPFPSASTSYWPGYTRVNISKIQSNFYLKILFFELNY